MRDLVLRLECDTFVFTGCCRKMRSGVSHAKELTMLNDISPGDYGDPSL